LVLEVVKRDVLKHNYYLDKKDRLVLEDRRNEQPPEPEDKKQDRLNHSYSLDKSVRLVLEVKKKEQRQGPGVKKRELVFVKLVQKLE
tara:strand:+ start:329 stop:589 length:261 start_codon:yes stop_codon:yes gene_type:complete